MGDSGNPAFLRNQFILALVPLYSSRHKRCHFSIIIVTSGDEHGGCAPLDTVIFSAADFLHLTEKLQLDLHEPPMSQVAIV